MPRASQPARHSTALAHPPSAAKALQRRMERPALPRLSIPRRHCSPGDGMPRASQPAPHSTALAHPPSAAKAPERRMKPHSRRASEKKNSQKLHHWS